MVEIKKLGTEHIQLLIPLLEDFWNHLNTLHEARNKSFDAERTGQVLAQTISWPGHNFYGAFLENRLVGFADFWILPDIFHGGNVLNLQDLYLVPDARGKGIGRALAEFIISQAREHDVTDVHVEVLEENVEAQRFYEKMGLTERMVLLQGQF